MIRLRMLGGIDVWRDDERVEAVLRQPKRFALLAYLATSSDAALRRRDLVVAIFWPEADGPRARDSLSAALSFLRRRLGADALLSRGDEEIGVDPRQADQNLRDNIVLPSGTGKTVRVAVFAEEDVAKEALKAGADVAGYEDFLKQLDKGEINFDVLVATPNVMAKLSKYARILGPKGLMPNPKSGTVTKDVNKAISQSKAGKVEYRVDSTGIVHLGIGKVSFGRDKINKNVEAVFTSLKTNKPSSLKGTYVKSVTITTTMGPGVKVLISELS